MPGHFPSSSVSLVQVQQTNFLVRFSFACNALTFSSSPLVPRFLIWSTFHAPCSMANPHLIVSLKFRSSLTHQTHLPLRYNSEKQQPPCGICWNSWNLAVTWFICCLILSETFVMASSQVFVSTTEPTWSNKLFMLSLPTSLKHSFGFFASATVIMVVHMCSICTCRISETQWS